MKTKNKARIYYGWYIAITASMISLMTSGFRMGIGPFVRPIISDLGMSRTDLAFILAVSSIVYGIAMVLAGVLLRYFNTRIVLISGVVLDCLAIFGAVNSHGMLQFLLTFGILLSFGLAFTSQVTLTPIISRWFVYQKGKALFLLSTGSMAGLAVMTPLETTLIGYVGWQKTLTVVGLLLIAIIVPVAIFVFRENVPEGADGGSTKGRYMSSVKPVLMQPDLTWKDALKTRAYWQIAGGFFVCGFSMNLMGTNAVPMLIDHHFAATTASYGVGMIGMAAIIGTFILGAIADRYPRKNFLALMYLIRGFGFFGLVFASTSWQLYLLAATAGLVWAGSAAMSSAILSDLFGTGLVGLLFGSVYFVHQVGGAIGSFLGGWGYEKFGTHLVSFGLATVLLIFAAWVSYSLPKQRALAVTTNSKPYIKVDSI